MVHRGGWIRRASGKIALRTGPRIRRDDRQQSLADLAERQRTAGQPQHGCWTPAQRARQARTPAAGLLAAVRSGPAGPAQRLRRPASKADVFDLKLRPSSSGGSGAEAEASNSTGASRRRDLDGMPRGGTPAPPRADLERMLELSAGLVESAALRGDRTGGRGGQRHCGWAPPQTRGSVGRDLSEPPGARLPGLGHAPPGRHRRSRTGPSGSPPCGLRRAPPGGPWRHHALARLAAVQVAGPV